MKKIPSIITYIISIFSILLIWNIFAKSINAPLILPTPGQVFKKLFLIIQSFDFWCHFFATFVRVLQSFIISVLLGTLIGFLCGISKFFTDFFEIPLSVVRATPVVAFILVAYFWFSSNQVPVFVSVLMTLPIMITAVVSGFTNIDKNILQMAKTYELSKKEILKYIKIPSSVPLICNGALSCFGLSWKVVAAGEVICLPKNAIGTLLQKSQVYLQTDEVIAQTIVLVIVSFLMEKFFSVLVKKGLKKYGLSSN